MARMQRIRKDTPQLKTRIRENYDAVARHYNLVLGIYEWLGVARLRRRLLGRARGRVLEIAVGTGQNLRHYPPGVRLYATDLSVGMAEEARREAARRGLSVVLALMDAEHLAFPDDAFDTVVCTYATGTFPTPQQALAEMRRVVAPQGQVLMIEHAYSDQPVVRRLQDWWGDRQFAWLGNRWRYEPEALAQEAGLTVEAHGRTFFRIIHSLVLRPGKT